MNEQTKKVHTIVPYKEGGYSEAACPKCEEFDDVSIKFIAEPGPSFREYLLLECNVCGYSWLMRCADDPDRDKHGSLEEAAALPSAALTPL